MPRLGSVLGAILAEVARARLVADHLSRDLVDDYRADPILASMSVPRVLVDQAVLTVRFSVSEMVEAEVATPAEASAALGWARHLASAVIPAVLDRHGLGDAERRATLARLVGSRDAPSIEIPPTVMRDALAGDFVGSSRATTDALLQTWASLPREVRVKLGGKAAFRRELEGRLAREVASFVSRVREVELVKAALASRIDVGIRPDDLPTQSERIQELTLTLRGEDLSLIVESDGEQ
jgi:hypothetical protein